MGPHRQSTDGPNQHVLMQAIDAPGPDGCYTGNFAVGPEPQFKSHACPLIGYLTPLVALLMVVISAFIYEKAIKRYQGVGH